MTINPYDRQSWPTPPHIRLPDTDLPSAEEIIRKSMASQAARNKTAAAHILMREGWSFDEVAKVLGYSSGEEVKGISGFPIQHL